VAPNSRKEDFVSSHILAQGSGQELGARIKLQHVWEGTFIFAQANCYGQLTIRLVGRNCPSDGLDPTPLALLLFWEPLQAPHLHFL
jgi:hypothetical protein